MVTLPQDILELIIEELAKSPQPEWALPTTQRALEVCAISSRSFYWPATRFIFKEVNLSALDVPCQNFDEESSLSALASMAAAANAPLHRFVEVITTNPDILPLIESLRIGIDRSFLIFSPGGEFWHILDLLFLCKRSLKSVAVVGPRARADYWPWLSIIEDSESHLGMFIKVLGMATEKLHFEGVFVCPVEQLLSQFRSVGRVSLSRVDVWKNDSNLYISFSTYTILKPIAHIRNLSISACSLTDVNMANVVLGLCFQHLVDLDITFPRVKTFRYLSEYDLARFPELRVFRVSTVLRAIPRTPYDRSGYGCQGDYLSSYSLVEPLVHESSPTGIEKLIVNLLLHYTMRELYNLLWDLRSHSADTPFDPDLDVFWWEDFDPNSFMKKHPNLLKLVLNIRLVASYPHKNDDDRIVMEDFEYDPDKSTLEKLFSQIIRLKIFDVEGEEGIPEHFREIVEVNVEFL